MEMMRRDDDLPEQRLADPSLSLGDYAAECRRALRQCIEGIFWDMAAQIWRSWEIDTDGMIRRALECHGSYFQSLKGGTNLSEDRVSEGVLWETGRQRNLHRLMRELKDRFEAQDVKFEVVDTGYYPGQTLWVFNQEPGCTVSIDGLPSMIAFPPAGARTYDYMVPRSGPIAWQVALINASGMVFVPCHEDLGERFGAASSEVFPRGEVVDINTDLEVQRALSYGDYLDLSLVSDIDLGALNNILERTGVSWVIAGNPFNFEAVIYNGKPDETPWLIREIMPESVI